jgi:hypothetical protein
MSAVTKSITDADGVPADLAESLGKISNLIERDNEIKKAAKEHDVSVGAIKAEIARCQKNAEVVSIDGAGKRSVEQAHWNVKPCAQKVNGKELITDILARLESHVSAPKEALLTAALWIQFAWAHDAFVHSPMLLVTSPEPECGKSTLLALVGFLVPRGLVIVEVSSAVLFRMIEFWNPTVIIDEADDAFKNNPELRTVMNSGWTRGAGVPRCHPDTHEPEFFLTFGPKAIGIKGLKVPATTLSRSLVIEMERKLPGEKVQSFAHADDGRLADLRSRLARFALDNTEQLKGARPKMPEGFNNRLEANWKPLLAIAERCGVGEEARAAAVTLSRRSDEASIRVELLSDIVGILEKRGADRMHSEDIVSALVAMENRPWAEWGYRNPKPITKNQLAALLKPLNVKSRQIKLGGENLWGYELSSLKPVLARYQSVPTCEEGVSQVATSLPPYENKGLRGIPNTTGGDEVVFQNPPNPLEIKAGSAVAFQNAPRGHSLTRCSACDGAGCPYCSPKQFGLKWQRGGAA